MKRLPIIIFLSLFTEMILSGCYTQFATLDRRAETESAPSTTDTDSAGDSIQATQRIDTVTIRERETCYWERDFFGRPRLRCYRNYYDDDWYDD